MKPGALRLVNRTLFGMTAAPYDWLASREPWLEHCRRMARHLPAAGARRVLDLGCGPGNSTLGWLQAAAEDRVVGLDLSAPMLARARRRLRRTGLEHRSSLVLGDALALPFRDGSFDVVTSHSVLYLLPERRRALAEIQRVLRVGGALLLLEPAEGFPWGRLGRLARQSPGFALTVLGWRLAGKVAGRFDPGSLRETLAAAGFEQLQVEPAFEGAGLLALGRRRP